MVSADLHLDSGQHHQQVFLGSDSVLERFAFQEGFHSEKAPAKPLLFVGYILYIDAMNRRRRTAFLREYDYATHRFNAIKHHDYEYQD